MNEDKPAKDKWDKAEIVFKFLGGVMAAVLVALLGIYGNKYLHDKERRDNDITLYTQLLTNKETAENSLRATMFGEMLKSFLTPDDASKKNSQPHLAKIREMRLSLELLARNFHESLDMKPLFEHLLMQIIRPRISLNKCLKVLDDHSARMTQKAKDTCREAIELEKEENNYISKTDAKPIELKNRINRLSRNYDREMDLLVKSAKRVVRKQREVLEQVAGTLLLEIPLKGPSADKVCTRYAPIDWLPSEAGTCTTEDGREVSVDGIVKESTLYLKETSGGADTKGKGDKGEEKAKALSRYFKVRVRYIYPKWKQVFVEVLTCPEKTGCEERTADDPEKQEAAFWVEYFDFPLVDNSYLNDKERYSVILEDFKEGEDGEEVKAEIALLYYPASYAGLKEKSFYNNQLMQGLLNRDLFK